MAGRTIGTATVEVKADTSGFKSALDGLTSGFGSFRSKLQGLVAGIGFGELAKKAIEFGASYQTAIDQAAASISGLVGVQKFLGRRLRPRQGAAPPGPPPRWKGSPLRKRPPPTC